MIFRDVEVRGRRCDVLVRDGVITAVGEVPDTPGEDVVEGHGGALIPGLADHHVHLAATAAARGSVNAEGLTAAALAQQIAARTGPVRVTGWHESEPLARLDRAALERIAPGRDVRVQHRSGSLWVLSTACLDTLAPPDHPGLDRETGWLFQGDAWLRERRGGELPELGQLASELLALGITHLTDATPDLSPEVTAALHAAFPQHLQLLGDPAASCPWKLLLAEHDLPPLDDLVGRVRWARDRDRAVAIHSVTRESLLLALAALGEVGPHPGDRIEHAAVVPETVLAGRGLTVVTQPGIAATRGDAHLREVDPADLPWLWPLNSLLTQGIPVALSSDAPHGPLDPWAVMRAARDRVTPSRAVANPGERITAAQALAAMTTPLDAPGGRPREVTVGQPADLVLCHPPLDGVLADLDASVVRATYALGLGFSQNTLR